MTKVRSPATFADAITRIAGRIGWLAMAEAVGKTERAVRNWSDPDMERSPSAQEAVALDALYLAAGGGEPPMLAAYQLQLDRRVEPPADSADLVLAVAASAKEAGEAVAALVQAAQPGACAGMRALAGKELAEAIEALNDALRKLGVAPNVEPLRRVG